MTEYVIGMEATVRYSQDAPTREVAEHNAEQELHFDTDGTVEDVEVVDVEVVATDGGTPMASTIVGDPQHPAETAMPPYDGPPEDYERADPHEIDCPRGHAEAGEPCWVVESTDRDVYCAARQRQARRGNDE